MKHVLKTQQRTFSKKENASSLVYRNKLSVAITCATLLMVGCASEVSEQRTTQPTHKPNETVSTAPPRQRLEQKTATQDKKFQENKNSESESSQLQDLAVAPASKVMAESFTGNSARLYSSKQKSIALNGQRPIRSFEKDYIGPIANTEKYNHRDENGIKLTADEPVSTFSIDVDTASYSVVRRMLQGGRMPRADAVRVEELINYFNYGYKSPDRSEQPFSVHTEIAPSPWAKGKHLLHVGLQGFDIPKAELPASNLVFLLDVSGSMNRPNKLPLLKTSLKLLSKQLSANDKVSIVVYAGAAGVVLEPTQGNDTYAISNALNKLRAGGSTNGGAGIDLAYSMAERSFIKGGINRVILATDGDFNVGVSDHESLKRLIENKRKTGIYLTTLGFGMGNYNDMLMNELAEIGNGNAAYIDTALEARKVLVDEVSSTLMTIAKDVKIQVEFSPNVVEYRLIGYESRLLKREDFNNDQKDAGEIGAGHSITAMYEITLANSDNKSIDPLRYQHTKHPEPKEVSNFANELAFLKLRYKLPSENKSTLIKQPISMHSIKSDLSSTSNDYRFSAAVVGFAQLLKNSAYSNNFGYSDIEALAKQAQGKDKFGYRSEFIKLVKMADTLNMANTPTQPLPIIAKESFLR